MKDSEDKQMAQFQSYRFLNKIDNVLFLKSDSLIEIDLLSIFFH